MRRRGGSQWQDDVVREGEKKDLRQVDPSRQLSARRILTEQQAPIEIS